MNEVAYFEIQSSDTTRAIEILRSRFRLEVNKDNNLPIEYYRIETSRMHGGLLQRPGKIPPTECGTNAFVCSIQVANFDHTSDKILNNGGERLLSKNLPYKVNVGKATSLIRQQYFRNI
jgi:predicted enzyme related to lactoylglutathione lyase